MADDFNQRLALWPTISATTTRLFPKSTSTSTIPTIGSTTTITQVTKHYEYLHSREKPWIDPKSTPAFDDEVTTTTTMVKKSSTTTKVQDVRITEDSTPSETTDSTVSTTTPEKTTTLVWPDYVSWADYGYEDTEEKTTTTPPSRRTKSNKRRTKTLSTTPLPSGGRETTPTLQKTTTTPMNATSGRLTRFRMTTDNRITKEKKITKDVLWDLSIFYIYGKKPMKIKLPVGAI
uniref:Uncharacterized protein n=1 Tax=Romanomermis culicivorax TaxID=13658 RepID=A0A915JVJ5_ROMCU